MKKKNKREARQVVVIHGGESFRSRREYISWLKGLEIDFERYRAASPPGWKKSLGAELGARYEVIQPDMPNKLNAHYEEWKIWFEKFAPHLKNGLVLIGHSLGGIFMAKYLSENRFRRKIRATFLVAAPFGWGDFSRPKNLRRLALQGGKIFIYQSRDDSEVGFDHFERYEKALSGATLRVFKNRGHFNQTKIPELVRDIKSLF